MEGLTVERRESQPECLDTPDTSLVGITVAVGAGAESSGDLVSDGGVDTTEPCAVSVAATA
jgi:hypothetical protein